MAEENESLAAIERYFEAQNRRDWEMLDSVLGRNVVFTVVPYNVVVRGALQVVGGSRAQHDQLPDVRTEITNAFACGDDGMAETVTTYTHTSDWHTGIPGLPVVPATGRQVSRPGVFIFKLRSGKIMRIAHYNDRVTSMLQLGILSDLQ